MAENNYVKAAKERTQKILEKDPNYFSKMSKKAQKARGGKNAKNSFHNNKELAKMAGIKSGEARRRRKEESSSEKKA